MVIADLSANFILAFGCVCTSVTVNFINHGKYEKLTERFDTFDERFNGTAKSKTLLGGSDFGTNSNFGNNRLRYLDMVSNAFLARLQALPREEPSTILHEFSQAQTSTKLFDFNWK